MVFSESGNEASIDFGLIDDYAKLEELFNKYAEDIKEFEIQRIPVKFWDVLCKEKESGDYYKEKLYTGKIDLVRKVFKPVAFEPIHPVRYNLPQPSSVNTSKNTKSYKTALIVPDSQNTYYRDARTGYLDPVHDRRCWALVFHLCESLKPDNVVFLGDMVDLPDFSKKYLCTPEMRNTTQATLNEMGFILSRIRTMLPQAKLDYILGNHEKRLANSIVDNMVAAYGLTKANDRDGLPVMSIPYLLGFNDLNIQVTESFPDGEVWLNREVMCCHTSGYVGGTGGTAKRFLEREAHYSVTSGHCHRNELLYKTVYVEGKKIVRFAGSPGTIAIPEKTPANSKKNDWQQGLWLIHYEDGGYEAEVEPLLIKEGKTRFRGELLEAQYPLDELREFTQCEFY